MCRRFCSWLLIAGGCLLVAPATRAANPEVVKEAYAILQAKCLSCHTGEKAKGSLDLSTVDGLLKGGDSGPGYVPGKLLDESTVWIRVGVDKDMPPEKSGKTISVQESLLLRNWILEGAVYPTPEMINPAVASNTMPASSTAATTPATTTPATATPAAAVEAEPGRLKVPEPTLPLANDANVAAAAFQVLKKYCYDCHGQVVKGGLTDVTSHKELLTPRGQDSPFVTAFHPEKSLIWTFMGIDRSMPPQNKPQPSEAERDLVKAWIQSGAPSFTGSGSGREFLTEETLLRAILADVKATPRPIRRHHRYFSLAHLVNNPTESEAELRLYRAAFSKMLNMLKRTGGTITVPTIIHESGALLRIDRRDFSFDDAMWDIILKSYPYGLVYSNAALNTLVNDIRDEVGDIGFDGIPYLRADWFVAKTARPRLYYTILQIPNTMEELEKQLGVNVPGNFIDGSIARAGFNQSGVSRHNRLLERHKIPGDGMYWKSYDFSGPGLFQKPLGPDFAEYKTSFDRNRIFPEEAFKHDGGEMIWTLPNGLHAYALATGDGKRLSVGPTTIVEDALRSDGRPDVINPVSCIGCHNLGMKASFKDAVRISFQGRPIAQDKVADLYPEKRQMDEIVQLDALRFKARVEEATAPFLKVGSDAPKDIFDFPEPVTVLVKRYDRDLAMEDVAYELGMKAENLKQTLPIVSSLSTRANLAPLVGGEKIKRDSWEKFSPRSSAFHAAADILQIGKFKTFGNKEEFYDGDAAHKLPHDKN